MVEGHLTSKCYPLPAWTTASPFSPPHTIESLETPISLHRRVGTKGKAVGTVSTGLVRVLTGSTDNHAMILAGCAEVSSGHRGQSWGQGRRSLQEVDHKSCRGAQCWLICREGSVKLEVGVILESLDWSLSQQSMSLPLLIPLPHHLPPLYPSLPSPSSSPRQTLPHNVLHPLHYLNSCQAFLCPSGCQACPHCPITTSPTAGASAQ